MPSVTRSSVKIAALLAVGTSLAACVNDTSNDGVRGGPQAVHPSGSVLAQGGRLNLPAATCGGEGQPACTAAATTYKPVAGDGSKPIID